MPDTDSNEFLDLPSDREEAFAVHQKRKYAELKADKVENSDAAREYVDAVIAFCEAMDFNLFDKYGEPPYEEQDFWQYFYHFRRHAEIESAKIEARSAARLKEIDTSIIILDSDRRKAIRKLIESIRAKLNALTLDDAKREALFNKLNAFAAEVDRDRTRTEALFAFVIEAGRVAKQVGPDATPLLDVMERITDLVDAATKWIALPSSVSPKRLQGPPKQLPAPDGDGASEKEYGDDIPF